MYSSLPVTLGLPGNITVEAITGMPFPCIQEYSAKRKTTIKHKV